MVAHFVAGTRHLQKLVVVVAEIPAVASQEAGDLDAQFFCQREQVCDVAFGCVVKGETGGGFVAIPWNYGNDAHKTPSTLKNSTKNNKKVPRKKLILHDYEKRKTCYID